MALQDVFLAMSQPVTATLLALGTVFVVGADTAPCLTVVTLVLALALTVWKVGCPAYLLCIVSLSHKDGFTVSSGTELRYDS